MFSIVIFTKLLRNIVRIHPTAVCKAWVWILPCIFTLFMQYKKNPSKCFFACICLVDVLVHLIYSRRIVAQRIKLDGKLILFRLGFLSLNSFWNRNYVVEMFWNPELSFHLVRKSVVHRDYLKRSISLSSLCSCFWSLSKTWSHDDK